MEYRSYRITHIKMAFASTQKLINKGCFIDRHDFVSPFTGLYKIIEK